MKAFVLSPEAERDLQDINSYLLKQAGVRITRYVMREPRATIRFAAKNPGSGHAREDLTEEAVKFRSVFSYLIVYDPATRPIAIARILHANRDVERILN